MAVPDGSVLCGAPESGDVVEIAGERSSAQVDTLWESTVLREGLKSRRGESWALLTRRRVDLIRIYCDS